MNQNLVSFNVYWQTIYLWSHITIILSLPLRRRPLPIWKKAIILLLGKSAMNIKFNNWKIVVILPADVIVVAPMGYKILMKMTIMKQTVMFPIFCPILNGCSLLTGSDYGDGSTIRSLKRKEKSLFLIMYLTKCQSHFFHLMTSEINLKIFPIGDKKTINPMKLS